ncbi:MAG: PEP-CTERM sorting domain-containing protein, partial [Chroococcidiopsidaceae cyanobacterium CP_BM_RX_35]|nr:PEP-CTERM sorting domain-containing protein [Chroococcidiopsidaceae cyanobacterium CP_BM_RX_35]
DNPGQQNNFLLAVSKTSDPTAGWTGFTINSDSTGTRWADYPTLGFNKDGVYLAANMFPITSSSNCSQCTTTIVAVPKSSLLAGTDTNYTKFENQNPNSTGFSVQPLVNLDNNGLAEALLSSYNTPAGVLKRSDITGSINTPGTVQLNGSHGTTNPAPSVQDGSSTTSIGSNQFGNPIAVTDPDIPALPMLSGGQTSSPTLSTSNGFISIKPYNTASPAQQPGGQNTIDTGDTRLSSNVTLKNGIIWGLRDVQDPNSQRAALRFFKIRASDNTVLQDQLIGDPNSDYYYGSIAVNSSNNIVISFSRSNSQEYASSYAVLGEPDSSGKTTFNPPVLLHSGQASYQRLDSNGINRWGDYSATVLDPSDPSGSTFWTFQETGDVLADNWNTEIIQLKINQPANVPEPSSILGLFMFGALGISSLLKRSHQQS